jgi:hypothetical protein
VPSAACSAGRNFTAVDNSIATAGMLLARTASKEDRKEGVPKYRNDGVQEEERRDFRNTKRG